MQYKCSDCKQTWKEETPIDLCPECGSDNIRQINPMKKWIPIGAGAVILIIILLLFAGGKSFTTTAYIDFDQSTNRLTVELNGDKVKTDNQCNYRIAIQRNGANFGEAKKTAKLSKVFEEPGSYSIEIKWVNTQDKMPELHWNGPRSFTVAEKQYPPQIVAIIILDQNADKQLYKIRIQSDTGAISAKHTEYSTDGINYQSQPVFSNLKPGDYTFYARNANDISLVASLEESLAVIPKTHPTDAHLCKLLKQTAEGDASAYGNLINIAQTIGNISVSGKDQYIKSFRELINNTFATQNYTPIRTQREGDPKTGKILKIIIL